MNTNNPCPHVRRIFKIKVVLLPTFSKKINKALIHANTYSSSAITKLAKYHRNVLKKHIMQAPTMKSNDRPMKSTSMILKQLLRKQDLNFIAALVQKKKELADDSAINHDGRSSYSISLRIVMGKNGRNIQKRSGISSKITESDGQKCSNLNIDTLPPLARNFFHRIIQCPSYCASNTVIKA